MRTNDFSPSYIANFFRIFVFRFFFHFFFRIFFSNFCWPNSPLRQQQLLCINPPARLCPPPQKERDDTVRAWLDETSVTQSLVRALTLTCGTPNVNQRLVFPFLQQLFKYFSFKKLEFFVVVVGTTIYKRIRDIV